MALILPYRKESPMLGEAVFIAPTAAIIGAVTIGRDSSVWFGCTIRADANNIEIGAQSNIQDGSVVHVAHKAWPTLIGDSVTVGHQALLHGCVVESNAFIGMGAIVMDGCVVEEEGMLAAGAMLTPGKRIPKGEVWAGHPAKFMRFVTDEERVYFRQSAENYALLAQDYLAGE